MEDRPIKYLILRSTDGRNWSRLGDPYPNKMAADGACGAYRARSRGVTFKVVPFSAGFIAAELWLKGYAEGYITWYLKKFDGSSFKPRKKVAA